MTRFYLKYVGLVMCFFLVVNCSNDDESIDQPDPSTSAIVPVDIKFIYEDGTTANLGDCISDTDEIFIEITTEIQGGGNIVPTQINYTVNGVLFSMTFSSATSLRNPIDLSDGQNIAQLSDTGQTTELRFVDQGAFEQVL